MKDGANNRNINHALNKYAGVKSLSFYLSIFCHFSILFAIIIFNIQQKTDKIIRPIEIGLSNVPAKMNTGETKPAIQNAKTKAAFSDVKKAVKNKIQPSTGNKNDNQKSDLGNRDSTGSGNGAGNSSGIGNGNSNSGNGNAVADYYYVAVDQMPVPIGGMQSIIERMNLPVTNNSGSSIYLLVFIDMNGIVQKCEIVKGVNNNVDNIAIRILKNTKFQPGILNGKRVKVQLYISIPVN